MRPTKFQVIWPFGSGEEEKNWFSRWWPWRPSWISYQNDLSYFFIYKLTRCFLLSFNTNGLLVKEMKQKNFFKMAPWRPSWISDWNDFSFFFFDLQVTQCLVPSFMPIVLLVLEKKQKIDFQDGHHGSHLRFLFGTILAIFWSTSHSDASYQVSSQLTFWFRSRSEK